MAPGGRSLNLGPRRTRVGRQIGRHGGRDEPALRRHRLGAGHDPALAGGQLDVALDALLGSALDHGWDLAAQLGGLANHEHAGRSGKPPHFDYSIPGYTRWLRAYIDAVGLERFSLVVHDWGALGLALAQEMPERAVALTAVS